MALPIDDPSVSPSAHKYRLPVAFALVDGRRVIGWMSLSRVSRFREGPQTVLERLNEPVRLFPVVHSGATHLVMRDAIAWVIPSPGVEAANVVPPPLVHTHEELVVVALRSGDSLAGAVDIEMHTALNRTSDFLAGPDDFFLLRTVDGPRLIHKHQVVEVRLGVPREQVVPPPPSSDSKPVRTRSKPKAAVRARRTMATRKRTSSARS
jgi:hypothetical protein